MNSLKSPFRIFWKPLERIRYVVSRMTEKRSLKKTIVIGCKVLFAILNQMKENPQKIIDNTRALYVFTLLFNVLWIKNSDLKRRKFNFNISFFAGAMIKKLNLLHLKFMNTSNLPDLLIEPPG